MSIVNINPKKNRKKDEAVVLVVLTVIFVLVIWLALPQFNKFL